MGDTERSAESVRRELLKTLAQKACAVVDPGIQPEDVVIVFGSRFKQGAITCIWRKEVEKKSTYAYFYEAELFKGLKNEEALPKLCIQTVISKSSPFLDTPNLWYKIQGISTDNPIATRIEV